MNNVNKLRGFSLIELMIAMVLGLILSAGIFSVFSGNKRSNDLNTTMSDMQESARFVLTRIAADARMAGFQGCNDINRGGPQILANSSPTSNLELTATSGYAFSGGSWAPGGSLPTGVLSTPPPIEGSHALNLQFGSAASFPLVPLEGGPESIPSKTDPIVINTTTGISSEPFNLRAEDFAIISNCTGADLFEITGVSGGDGGEATLEHSSGANKSDSLTFDYIPNLSTKVMRFNSNFYYVADTGQTNGAGDMIPGLYQQSLPYTSAPTLLVTGVENLRFEFGLRTGPDSLAYLPAGNGGITNSQIETIRIGLLMVSENRVSSQPNNATFMLAGQPVTSPGDRRYRQAFNTTVKIRNRRVE